MDTNRRVLVVCQHFWPESFRINDIADYLVERDCQIDVLCGIPNYPKGHFFPGYSYFKNRKQQHHSINIRRAFEIPRGTNTNWRIFLNYVSFPIASLFHLPRLLSHRYDKILLYQLSPVMMSLAGILVGRLKKIETTMYVLDLWPENLYSVLPIKNSVLRKIVGGLSHWHYRHVDKLVVLSETMKQRLEEIGVQPSRIIILPQACEKIYEQEIHDASLQKRFSKTFNIVFTGNISPAQSFETIIEAAQLLQVAGLKEAHWVIVGDGMSRQWLEKAVADAGLISAFSFEGQKPIEEIPKYTAIADVLVGCLVKSDLLEATIPAKVLSYIASGKPIVLAMDGEAQKLINETIGCGFAGPTEDAEQLAENIEKIYAMSPAQRQKLGQKAKKYHFAHLERNLILGKLYSFIFG